MPSKSALLLDASGVFGRKFQQKYAHKNQGYANYNKCPTLDGSWTDVSLRLRLLLE
jgi:hypothetical protein